MVCTVDAAAEQWNTNSTNVRRSYIRRYASLHNTDAVAEAESQYEGSTTPFIASITLKALMVGSRVRIKHEKQTALIDCPVNRIRSKLILIAHC